MKEHHLGTAAKIIINKALEGEVDFLIFFFLQNYLKSLADPLEVVISVFFVSADVAP